MTELSWERSFDGKREKVRSEERLSLRGQAGFKGAHDSPRGNYYGLTCGPTPNHMFSPDPQCIESGDRVSGVIKVKLGHISRT